MEHIQFIHGALQFHKYNISQLVYYRHCQCAPTGNQCTDNVYVLLLYRDQKCWSVILVIEGLCERESFQSVTTCCSVLHPRSSGMTMHISADVQRITLNASCMTISGERTKQFDIVAGFLPRHWIYEWFSQFHSCGTYAFFSQSPSIEWCDCRYQHILTTPSVHTLSLHFSGHFPGGPGLAGTRTSTFWIYWSYWWWWQLEL